MASDNQLKFDPSSASQSDLVNWLREALTSYKESQSRWAFSPITLLIGDQDDLAHDLNSYVESLKTRAKKRWRAAVFTLLSDMSIQDEDIAIVLVDLAVLRRSNDLMTLLPQLTEQSFAGERLLERILAAVLDLPLKAEASRKCLETLAQNDAFPARSAGLVLQALCHVAPDDWMDHARLVSKMMPDPETANSEESKYLLACAETLLKEIGMERLGKHWYELNFANDLNWLRSSLQSGETPLVKEEINRLKS